MKILVVCQHYWPEPFQLSDVCESLVRRGHTVHVITDVPNYPEGYIYKDYKKGKRRKEEKDGVRITRTFTVGRRKGILFRLLNYYSFAWSSKRFAKKLKEEYDVVFTNQLSPVMMTGAALAYAKKRGKKCVLYCMDLWPASLAAGGIREGSFIYRHFAKVSKKHYTRADKILITSQMFADYFSEQFGIAGEERISYLPQYADDRFDAVASTTQQQKDTVDLVFAGNVGAAQSMPTIVHAAKRLSDHPELRWHIVGDGSELENTKRLAEELGVTNVIFHGRHPVEEMPQYYAMADAMLVTLTADPIISLTLPAKVQSYMAAGKPVLAAANGEIPKVIAAADCGFCAEAENAEAFAEAVRKFLDGGDRTAMGARARAYYDAHFTKEMFLDTLERVLEQHVTK
jgi:glycosyltransferase involved in cell wall biosynthesis